MAFTPGNIAKGPLFYYLDELSRGPDSMSHLVSLLQALEQLQPTFQGLIPIFETHLLTDYDPNDRTRLLDHIRNHWFGGASGWWPGEQPIEPIFCQGLIKAITESVNNPLTVVAPDTEEAQQHALPIDTYWICDASHFEILICRSPQQITLLFLTPPPPIRNPGIWSAETPVWSVRRNVVDIEEQEQADEQEEVPEGTVEGKIVEWRRESQVLIIRMRHRPPDEE